MVCQSMSASLAAQSVSPRHSIATSSYYLMLARFWVFSAHSCSLFRSSDRFCCRALLIVPLILGTIAALGLMITCGIELNSNATAALAIASGVGIDSEVYLLYRVREEYLRLHDFREALVQGYVKIRRALHGIQWSANTWMLGAGSNPTVHRLCRIWHGSGTRPVLHHQRGGFSDRVVLVRRQNDHR